MIYLSVYRLRDDIELPTYGTTLANCFDLSFQPTSNVVTGYDSFQQFAKAIVSLKARLPATNHSILLFVTHVQKNTLSVLVDLAQLAFHQKLLRWRTGKSTDQRILAK